VGLCLLLVRKGWNSFLERCRNHTKPPATRQAAHLTLALEADTLSLNEKRAVSSLSVLHQARGLAGRFSFCGKSGSLTSLCLILPEFKGLVNPDLLGVNPSHGI
jgi:hypothetical protein